MLNPGIYKAKVSGATFDTITSKTSGESFPVLKVFFLPYAAKEGSVFVDGNFDTTEKTYFLSDSLVKSGKNAGRSSLEVLREEIQATYGIEKPRLNQETLDALVGKSLSITVEMKNNFTNVKYVNAPGSFKSPGSRSKRIDPELLAKLDSAFTGNKEVAPAGNFWSELEGKAA